MYDTVMDRAGILNLSHLRINVLTLKHRKIEKLERYLPCSNLAECLGNFNLLFPIRLNFNPITAYDRIKSHYSGNSGWSRKETQNFERLQNKIRRIRAKQHVRNRMHLEEKKLWRSRILQRKKELQRYTSNIF